MLRSILSKRSLWVISGLVALHTRLLPIWSILGRKLRMLTVALPSLEAFEKKRINIKWLFLSLFRGSIIPSIPKIFFFQFWQFLTHFWTILANMVHFGSKTEDAYCGVPVARSLFYEEQIEWIGFLLHTYRPRPFSFFLAHCHTRVSA